MTYRIKLLSLLLAFGYLSNAQMLKQTDKQLHFLAGSTISAATYSLTYANTKSKKKAFIYSVASGVVAGTIKELIDSQKQGNRFDAKDLQATVLGSLSVSITLEIFTKKWK
jgi:uncharacterized protein YfiM (DUF2279 family)